VVAADWDAPRAAAGFVARTKALASLPSPASQPAGNVVVEAALNALFQAVTVTGRDGHVLHALPVERTLDLLRRWHPL
jgi:L-aminopeptidase/D-esterase-like protein